MIEYDQKTAKKVENNYITPEMMYQRLRTIGGLELQPDEHVLDAGGGTGLLSRRMFDAWNDAVPSPKLPVQLEPLLDKQGFTAIHVEPIPILNRSYRIGNFSVDTLEWVAQYTPKQGAVTKKKAVKWLTDLFRLGEKDEFFFCVNRFLFTAVKQEI